MRMRLDLGPGLHHSLSVAAWAIARSKLAGRVLLAGGRGLAAEGTVVAGAEEDPLAREHHLPLAAPGLGQQPLGLLTLLLDLGQTLALGGQ
jgi:hypothetical protein